MQKKWVIIFLLTVLQVNCQRYYGELLKSNVEFFFAHYQTWKEIEKRDIYSYEKMWAKSVSLRKVNVEMTLLLGRYDISYIGVDCTFKKNSALQGKRRRGRNVTIKWVWTWYNIYE